MHGTLQSFLGLWHLLLALFGSDEEFVVFSDSLSRVDPSIGMIWTKLNLHAVYLDLSMQILPYTVYYYVYSKPANAFANLPMGSFHVRRNISRVYQDMPAKG